MTAKRTKKTLPKNQKIKASSSPGHVIGPDGRVQLSPAQRDQLDRARTIALSSRWEKDAKRLASKRFGQLVAVKRSDRVGWWRCACGIEKEIRRTSVLYSGQRTCGHDITRHGYTGTPEHRAWCSMLSRCTNVDHANYANYGGRGITVCDRWRTSFTAFLADVGHRPSIKHSLDRYPNNNGNYEPGNVRWATASEQLRNTRNNRVLTAYGKTMCVTEWAEYLDIDGSTLIGRLNVGWSTEAALTTTVDRRKASKKRKSA